MQILLTLLCERTNLLNLKRVGFQDYMVQTSYYGLLKEQPWMKFSTIEMEFLF